MKKRDQRKGKPSASSMYRLDGCPGSDNLIRQCEPAKTKEQDEWGKSGDLVHKYLAKPTCKNLKALNPDQLSVAQSCQEQRNTILEQVFNGQEFTSLVEHRLWFSLEHPQNHSGQSDEACISYDHKTAVVIDYKSLPGDVESAEGNLQLMTLVELLWANMPELENIFAAIVQPLVSSKPTIAHYHREAMAAAKSRILNIVAESQKPDAPRNAGKYCDYCPAKLQCPQAKAVVTETAVVPLNDVSVMTPDKLAVFLTFCKNAKPIIKAAEERGKQLLREDPECMPGWTLEPGNKTRTVTNNKEAIKLMTSISPLSELLEHLKVPLPAMENLVAERLKLKKIEAKAKVNELLASCIEVNEQESSLKPVK